MENTTGSFSKPTIDNEYNGDVGITFTDSSYGPNEFQFNQSYILSVYDGSAWVEGDVDQAGSGFPIKMEWVDPSTLPTNYSTYLKITVNYDDNAGTDTYVVGVSNGTGTVLKSIPEAGQSQLHTSLTPQGNNTYVIGSYDGGMQENVTGSYTIDFSDEDNPVKWVPDSGDCVATWPGVEVLTKEQAEALINS